MIENSRKSTQQQDDKIQEKINKAEEKRKLIADSYEFDNSRGWDENLDKLLEKSRLIGGVKYPSIIGDVKGYVKKYPLEYYRQIYKLHNWDTSGKKLFNRPGIVGKWTNHLIYLRFPTGTLKELQALNPPNAEGIRIYKHFQWLTVLGEEQLEQFIDDAISLMSECKYWNQFIRKFAKKFGKPWQMDLFEDCLGNSL